MLENNDGSKEKIEKLVNINKYGFNDYFKALSEQYPKLTVGRIISQEKGMYHLICEKGEFIGEVSGKFRFENINISLYPAVGDFVMIDCQKNERRAIIHNVLKRKSAFVRKAAGTSRNEQVVAANIDTIFICMSLNNDFNIRRIERYLTICWESGAKPVIVLTKSDLCKDINIKKEKLESVAIGVDILFTSSIEENGYMQVLNYIKKGETIALIGSSGVGKSTLINSITGENRIDTNGLRNDDKGRHTTTRREMILLENGSLIIDTPGMRELGMWNISEGIEKSFSDIEELAHQCRFNDCSHMNEPGCAVRSAIEKGKLSNERLQAYRKLLLENEYAEDSKSYLALKEERFKNISKINKANKKINLNKNMK